MIELKVQCDCGQKYKFDVEPVNGLMPFRVNCPTCGLDGTEKANSVLQAQPQLPPAPAPMTSQLRLGVAPPPVVAAAPPMPTAQRYTPGANLPRPAMAARAPQKAAETTNLGLGILGAVIGALLGGGLMYGFYALTEMRFPLFGTGLGALTGLGARILYRGSDAVLGAISGGIAAAAVFGTLYMMYGEFPITSVITAIFGIMFAYRIAGA